MKTNIKIGDLDSLRKLAKNKTQLKVIENLYNQIGHTKKFIQDMRELDQAYKLAEKYPDIFKIVSVHYNSFLDFKGERVSKVY